MMSKKSKVSSTALKTLTTIALTLPGIQIARSESVITSPQTDLRYNRYDEGKLHYKIDVYQALLAFALSPKMDMTFKANQDVMTGASSYGYGPELLADPNGSATKLVPLRSGATIVNKRSAGDVNVRYFGDDYHFDMGGGISEENFYESLTFHTQYSKDFNKSNSEVTMGYSVSNDSIKPTPNSYTALLPLIRPPTRQGKVTQRAHLDVRQDLSTTSLVQAGVEFIADKGYMNDPYKVSFVYGDPNRVNTNEFLIPPGVFNPYPVFAGLLIDLRPDYKGTLATSAKFIQYISSLNSSIHLGFRFAKNTWDIKSYTFNIDYHQDVGDSWQFVPSVRYYTQSEAYFYAMTFTAQGTSPFPSKPIGNTGPASSDYRLAKFGSLTGELKVHYKFMQDQPAKLTIVGGYINRRNQYYWGKKPYPLNPDNDYKTYYGSIGISFVF
jgi:hypothetical protein